MTDIRAVLGMIDPTAEVVCKLAQSAAEASAGLLKVRGLCLNKTGKATDLEKQVCSP